MAAPQEPGGRAGVSKTRVALVVILMVATFLLLLAGFYFLAFRNDTSTDRSANQPPPARQISKKEMPA